MELDKGIEFIFLEMAEEYAGFLQKGLSSLDLGGFTKMAHA